MRAGFKSNNVQSQGLLEAGTWRMEKRYIHGGGDPRRALLQVRAGPCNSPVFADSLGLLPHGGQLSKAVKPTKDNTPVEAVNSEPDCCPFRNKLLFSAET